MGNTVGAILFLAGATYLGWTVVRGRAQSFLAAVSGGASGAAQPPTPPGKTGAGAPSTPQGGPIAGAQFQFGDQLSAPSPTVGGSVFGNNGNATLGYYGLYSPDYANAYQYSLSNPLYAQLFNL